MNNEIIIEPPAHIETEYRTGINQGIDAVHGVAGAVAASALTDSTITRGVERIARFIARWLDNGTDAAGVYDSRRAGAGYRVIRSAVFDTEKSHRERIVDAWRRVRKQDVSKSVTRREFSAILNAVVRQNVSLITDVSNQQALLIERAIRDAWRQPELQGVALKEQIQKIQRKGKNRAALIAENEIGNLHADLQMSRFLRLGVEEYFWRSSQDERVRSLHVSLNGKKYRVGHPTEAEGGLPPGKPIRCRCVAIPSFVKISLTQSDIDQRVQIFHNQIIERIASNDDYHLCQSCGGSRYAA